MYCIYLGLTYIHTPVLRVKQLQQTSNLTDPGAPAAPVSRGGDEGVQPIPPPRSIHPGVPNRTVSTVDTTQKRKMSDFFLHSQPQTSPKGFLREDEGRLTD